MMISGMVLGGIVCTACGRACGRFSNHHNSCPVKIFGTGSVVGDYANGAHLWHVTVEDTRQFIAAFDPGAFPALTFKGVPAINFHKVDSTCECEICQHVRVNW